MGIHTGEVERVGDDFRGRAVNRAARIMAVGHGGQILLSDVSAALVAHRAPARSSSPISARTGSATSPSRSGCGRSSTPTSRQQFPPVRGLDTYSNNLPAQRSSLVGRDQRRRSSVVALTRRHRIVTLTGVGGVGKTRLAVHAAAELLTEFADVWFVELASVADPDDVADAIARTVGAVAAVRPAGRGHGVAGRRTDAAGRSTTASTSIDSAAAVIDVLTAPVPRPVGRRDQS